MAHVVFLDIYHPFHTRLPNEAASSVEIEGGLGFRVKVKFGWVNR